MTADHEPGGEPVCMELHGEGTAGVGGTQTGLCRHGQEDIWVGGASRINVLLYY